MKNRIIIEFYKFFESIEKNKWTITKLSELPEDTIEFMWKTYQKEYSKRNMDLSVNSIDEFKREYSSLLVIDYDDDPYPDIFILFKKRKYGNKINLLWTDGKSPSKELLKNKLFELLRSNEYWFIEASLKIEELLSKSNINYIDDINIIQKIINKPIQYIENGYYKRSLSSINKWITKRIYGNINLEKI